MGFEEFFQAAKAEWKQSLSFLKVKPGINGHSELRTARNLILKGYSSKNTQLWCFAISDKRLPQGAAEYVVLLVSAHVIP